MFILRICKFKILFPTFAKTILFYKLKIRSIPYK